MARAGATEMTTKQKLLLEEKIDQFIEELIGDGDYDLYISDRQKDNMVTACIAVMDQAEDMQNFYEKEGLLKD